jgi:prepilin signal peptidase PulO-like enzyme (type II secretory pathway)
MDIPLWAAELIVNVLFGLWLFCFGATVGSFLNVVVYRLPRNQNIAYPGSYCPHCRHPIRLQDNIPILSWLNLRGRCRDCGGPISPRYLWVELTVAAAFLIVLLSEIYLPAGSLGFATRQPLTSRDGVAFWCMYATHVTLVTTMIGVILMRSDGSFVPARMFAPALTIALVLPLLYAEIRSVPAISWSEITGWQIGLIDGLAGLAMGAAVGFLASLPARRKGWSTPVVIAIGCSFGAVLGWQRTPIWLLVILPLCDLATYVVRSAAVPSRSLVPETQSPAPDGATASESPLEEESSHPL